MKRFVKDHPLWTAQGILFLLALLLLFSFQAFPSFAEGYSVTAGAAVRLLLGGITCLLPFSLFEITCGVGILYLLFFLGYLLVWGIQKVRKKKTRPILPFLLVIPAVLLLVFDLFVFGFAPSYYRHPTAEHMSLPMDEVDEEAVFGALEALCRIVNETAPSLEKNENGESVAPDLKEVKKRVTAACNSFGDSHSFYQNKGYNAKNFLISPLMTYTHISGVYGFFTGEANINTNYPHFIVTASLAHESAHARGIGPENECNFLASVVLLESGDEYLTYCGAIYVLDDFLDLCAEIDLEQTREAVKDLDPVYKKDMRAYARFFEPYRHSAASEVANTTNNAYLNAMGQEEGTLSYSRILRLVSAYFLKNSSR